MSVETIKAILSSQDNGRPNTYTFHPNGKLVYFLGAFPPSSKSTLYAAEIDSAGAPFQWHTVLDSVEHKGTLTKEEILLRERMRAVGSGLTSYIFDRSTCTFLLKFGDQLFTLCVKDQVSVAELPLTPTELPGCTKGGYNDLKFSPDSKLLSFVRNGEIFVKSLATGDEKQITNAKAGGDQKSAGVAEYVVQEEFSRYTGYWWSPVVDRSNADPVYWILYIEIDESEVERISLPSGSHDGTVDEYMFPKPGGKNATSKVFLGSLTIPETNATLEDAVALHFEFKPQINQSHPWIEYIIEAGWTQDGTGPWLQVTDRLQQKIQVLLWDKNNVVNSMTDQVPVVVWEETNTRWINCLDDQVKFLPARGDSTGKQSELGALIYASEKNGFSHFYYVEYDQSGVTKTHQVTDGEWIVLSQGSSVDTANSLIYFTSTIGNPTERNLCAVRFSSDGTKYPVQQLTPSGYVHIPTVNLATSLVAITSSSLQARAKTLLYKLNHDDGSASLSMLGEIDHPASPTFSNIPTNYPEMFSFTSSLGNVHYGIFYKPANYEPGKQYPAVIYVYGGPGVQLVTNSHHLSRHPEMQILSSNGYFVAMIDGRGSQNRGKRTHHRLSSPLFSRGKVQ
eukprot:TRINITY_DN741_c0_g1_i2.p1 TRINITY_DN741_c0_g1~~TRINITY_DN741_c0_g1_i2.p1  ORF type:complete len:621 (-),score=112.09 TRINITY_DN741_c0_g1_i2:90-1952(-)